MQFKCGSDEEEIYEADAFLSELAGPGRDRCFYRRLIDATKFAMYWCCSTGSYCSLYSDQSFNFVLSRLKENNTN